MRFSQRHKYVPIKDVFQVESVDGDLKNALWDAITIHYIDIFKSSDNADIQALFRSIWHELIKQPIDTMPPNIAGKISFLRSVFYSGPWHGIYDIIEYLPQNYHAVLSKDHRETRRRINDRFMDFCNGVLERENSAYRFVNGLIVPITSKEEIETIEKASSHGGQFKSVDIHIQTALNLLADRKTPDYRNSIKESISAVEALCRLITSDENASTLAKALNVLEAQHRLHPALKASFSSLYGYTSDADGIRHSMMSEQNLAFEDAYYMLVTCTAFINYLIAKISHKIK